jgi:hypothetical protein
MLLVKKLLGIVVLSLLLSGNALADQKSSFAKTLMDGVYIIDNAYWRSNDLLVFIEVSNTWSGADTYATAELVCNTLKDQGFNPISNYSVSMIEKTGQSQLLKLKCQ